jgi:hypothetical protein
MSRCIVVSKDGKYLTPRRNNGNLYESRTGWSKSLDDARIFQTVSSAKNSANANGGKKYRVVNVHIVVEDE